MRQMIIPYHEISRQSVPTSGAETLGYICQLNSFCRAGNKRVVGTYTVSNQRGHVMSAESVGLKSLFFQEYVALSY